MSAKSSSWLAEIVGATVVAGVVGAIAGHFIIPRFLALKAPKVTIGPMTRTIDHEAGVVCWTTTRAISCLPISETSLKP